MLSNAPVETQKRLRKELHDRPWSGLDKLSTFQPRATLYSVSLLMISGTKYEGQVKTSRGPREALDLFYFRVMGLIVGKGRCTQVESGTYSTMLGNLPFDGVERVRVLKY